MKTIYKSLGLLCLLLFNLLANHLCFAQPYICSYLDVNRNSIEKQCLRKALIIEADSNAYYKQHLHCKDSLRKTIALHEDNLTKIKNAKIDSINSQKEYLLEHYEMAITRPIITGFCFATIEFVFILFSIILCIAFNKYTKKVIIFFIFAIGINSFLGYYYYEKNELFWETKAKLAEVKKFSINKDKTIVQLRIEQSKSEQHIKKFEDKIKLRIQPDVEKIYQRQLFVNDSIEKVKAKKLAQFIHKNSVHKKLKIIACSWEKELDTPEHGYISGDLAGSAAGGGGGGAILGTGIVGGGGKSKTKGTLKGEYTGRVYGNEYRHFHFILSDNSYHVVDAKANKMWRMASLGLIIKYDKIYTDYIDFREELTPLYNETFR